MKEQNIGLILPFDEDEESTLRHIYNRRTRLFVVVFLFLIAAAFKSGLEIDGQTPRWSTTEEFYRHSEKETGLTRKQAYTLTISLLEGFVLLSAILVYRRRILPLKKDLRNGVKETVYYPVTQKQHFEHTGQFFIGTDDPAYLFHEVDIETWQQISVGESFIVYRAPHSKYVFNYRGRYTIM